MAPPHRWFDDFVDAGLPDVLSRPALQLILAIARRVDRQYETRVGLQRLAHEARLSRSKFFAAKAELVRCGLVEQVKLLGRRSPTLRLNPAVPGPAKRGLSGPRIGYSQVPETGTFRSPKRGLINGQDPPGTRGLALRRKKTKEQLGEKTKEQIVTSSQDLVVTKYPEKQGEPSADDAIPTEFRNDFAAAVRLVRDLPLTAREAGIEDAACGLARRMQAAGATTWTLAVRDALLAALAADAEEP